MKVDASTVRRVAHLARIAIDENEVERLSGELSAIMGFVEQLDEVDVRDVEPLTSVKPSALHMRDDRVTDGNYADEIVANAPMSEENFFLVPKVVE